MKFRAIVSTLAIIMVFAIMPVLSQTVFSIKGNIYNSKTNEAIPDANIKVADTPSGASSDNNGYFELKLTGGRYLLRVTSVGYDDKEVMVRIPDESSGLLKIGLMPKEVEIEGVNVFGRSFIPDRDTTMKRVPSSILPAVTTISSYEIEKQGAVTLIEALKFVPGGWTETRGRKTKQFFSVRGQKYPYPDYSINGIWQKEFEETGYFISALDIESVEIVRSASALVKGLSGLTGVVDIKTKKPQQETMAFYSKYGELNSYAANLQYGNRINEVSFNTSASLFGTDGPKGKNGKERIGNLYANLDWDLSRKLKLMTGATYISGLRQLMQIDEQTGAGNIKNRIEKYDPVRTVITFAKLNYSGDDRSQTELQTNFTYRSVDFTSFNVPQETSATHEENDWEYGLNVLHSRTLFAGNTLRFGGLYNHWKAPEGKRYYVGRACDVHTYSGVIASEQKAGRFLFDAGFRVIGGYIVEWGGFGIEGSATGFQNVAPIEDQAAPVEWQTALGTSYTIAGPLSLHYNFSAGVVAPRKGSLTSAGVAPDNEGRFQHDLGFRYKSPRRNEISVSSFYIKRNNAIDFSGQTIVTDNDLVMELYENAEKQSYGIELSAKFNLPVIHSSVFGNGMLMKADKEVNGAMTKDKQLPQVILNTGLYFEYSGFDANILVNYTGPFSNNRFVNPAWVQQHGDFPLGDFIAADITAGYTFFGNFNKRIFLEIKNILDKSYMTVAGYPDPGRIIMAGIRFYK